MADDLELLLRLAPVFRQLGPDDRRRLAGVARPRTFSRGDTIFSEGDEPDAFWVIVKGRVKVCKMTPAGKDVILEIFGPGDPFGTIAVYDGQPYPASAVAIEDTITVWIPRQSFFLLLEQHPTMVRGLLAGLTHRLVELTNRVAELSGGRVEPRVARLFLKLADEQGRPERSGTFIPVVLSRQELADMAGTTIETSIRIMSRWNKQRIVLTEKDGFLVLDRHELETLSLT